MTYEREQNVIAWAKHPFKAGPGTTGALTGGATVRLYPTLQELTAAEIPEAPAEPSVTAADTAVSNAAELQAMNGSNKYYLTADINLTGVVWTPIVNFTGVLDGRGYTISNLTINAPASDNRGLFGTVGAGVQIYNLTISGFTITGDDYVAALVAQHSATGTILIKDVDIVNCALTGDTYVAPLVGVAWNLTGGSIWNCTATNSTLIVANNSSGGLLGDIDLKTTATANLNVVNCEVVGGTLTSQDGSYCGGFVGLAVGNRTPTPDRYVYFHGCVTSMNIVFGTNGSPDCTGGFIGYAENTYFISCNARGSLTLGPGSSYFQGIGGFVGFEAASTPSYIDSYASGDITINATGVGIFQLVGGFGGKWDTSEIAVGAQTVTRCYATGDITITNMSDSVSWYGVGGFIGGYLSTYASASGSIIRRCWSEGDITFNHEGYPSITSYGGLGAFIGEFYHNGTNTSSLTYTIQNCYAWGSVTVTTGNQAYNLAVSGFIGDLDHGGSYGTTLQMTNCYDAQTDTAAGSGYSNQIPAGAYSKGLIGWIEDAKMILVETACFWDTDTSGIFEGNSEGHITDWMQTKSNYESAGWDFDTIWLGYDDTTYDYTSSGLGPNSVCVIPSSSEDEVWIVVSRVIGGQIVRYLEQMQPRKFGLQEDAWFIESALKYDGAGTTTLSGLDHLEGEEVVIWAEGAVMGSKTVTNGSITLDRAVTKAIVGLPFRYKLKPMRFDINTGASTTQTALKRISEVVVSFYETLGAKYGIDEDHLLDIDFRTTEGFGSPPAMFTGEKTLSPDGGFDAEDTLIITGNDGSPCTIRAMIPRLEVTGR